MDIKIYSLSLRLMRSWLDLLCYGGHACGPIVHLFIYVMYLDNNKNDSLINLMAKYSMLAHSSITVTIGGPAET